MKVLMGKSAIVTGAGRGLKGARMISSLSHCYTETVFFRLEGRTLSL